MVWLNHKSAFLRIAGMDRGLHWANLVVLFATALIPFPTAVVSSSIEQGNRFDDRVGFALAIS